MNFFCVRYNITVIGIMDKLHYCTFQEKSKNFPFLYKYKSIYWRKFEVLRRFPSDPL